MKSNGNTLLVYYIELGYILLQGYRSIKSKTVSQGLHELLAATCSTIKLYFLTIVKRKWSHRLDDQIDTDWLLPVIGQYIRYILQVHHNRSLSLSVCGRSSDLRCYGYSSATEGIAFR